MWPEEREPNKILPPNAAQTPAERRGGCTFRVGGVTPLTTIEWEGRLAAVIFAQGCPWRCRYCHNTSLIPRRGRLIPWEEIIQLLAERRGFLDAVVFSGGEPTAQPALWQALAEVKALGYEIALHTNGGQPRLLEAILQARLVDFVAMDVKGPFRRYEEITRRPGSGSQAQKSITAIIRSDVAYEFRTTYHSELLSEDDILQIAQDLHWRGAQAYFLQKYRSEGSGDMPLSLMPSRELRPALLHQLAEMFPRFGVRG